MPGRSIEARRSLGPPAEPWTISDVPRSSLERSFRRAGDGGMVLLAFPGRDRDAGFSPDYEVVKLRATKGDGHRLVTVRLRTRPETKGYRHDSTFVFDADDLFVVRSEHDVELDRLFEGRYEYDHEGNRPIFRVLTSMSVDRTPPKISTRLEVTECQFGAIPESEFALEPFLASLRPGELTWKHAEEPSTATLLDWYWLAFVGGGISLACGSGLAIGSRERDRRGATADGD